jgi:hypothetical protein
MIWYNKNNYKSQNWYTTTFLVHHFKDIAKGYSQDHSWSGWNNIQESGCHFTCLSMMAGIDHAYFAPKLRENKKHYFLSDKSFKAKRLNSTDVTSFVWDKNSPSSIDSEIKITKAFTSSHGFCNIIIKLKSLSEAYLLDEAIKKILEARKNNCHIICGPEDHSFLIAGKNKNNEVLVWEPDTSTMSHKQVTQMIDSGINLKKMFKNYKISKNNQLQILEHELIYEQI